MHNRVRTDFYFFVVVLSILVLPLSSSAHSYCEIVFGRRAVSAMPALRPDQTELGRGKSFIIYRTHDGKKRVLFDAREADIVSVTTTLNNTDNTMADFDYHSGRILALDGRHRVVSASQGYQIRKEIGGTEWPFWLDYSYIGKDDNPQRDPNARPGHNMLKPTEINITWDSSLFGVLQ